MAPAKVSGGRMTQLWELYSLPGGFRGSEEPCQGPGSPLYPQLIVDA